jgi:hypothetical protein
MKTINHDFAVEFDYREPFDASPSEDECRLVLQFMPELYADMMLLIKEEEEN